MDRISEMGMMYKNAERAAFEDMPVTREKRGLPDGTPEEVRARERDIAEKVNDYHRVFWAVFTAHVSLGMTARDVKNNCDTWDKEVYRELGIEKEVEQAKAAQKYSYEEEYTGFLGPCLLVLLVLGVIFMLIL